MAESRPLANTNIMAYNCQAVVVSQLSVNAKFDLFARAAKNPIPAKPKRGAYPPGVVQRGADLASLPTHTLDRLSRETRLN